MEVERYEGVVHVSRRFLVAGIGDDLSDDADDGEGGAGGDFRVGVLWVGGDEAAFVVVLLEIADYEGAVDVGEDYAVVFRGEGAVEIRRASGGIKALIMLQSRWRMVRVVSGVSMSVVLGYKCKCYKTQ